MKTTPRPFQRRSIPRLTLFLTHPNPLQRLSSNEPADAKLQERGDARKILRLAIPVSLESIFQMGFNFIDRSSLGYLGAMRSLPVRL
jgi:hypothetical protein